MFTQQINRNKSNTYVQMKTSFSPDNRIMKLGGAITASIEKLKNLKSQIMKMKMEPGSDLLKTVLDFKKEHQYFMQLSQDLNQVEQKSEIVVRLRTRVKQFVEGLKFQQIQTKTKNMRQNLIRASTQRGPDFYQSGQIGQIGQVQIESEISLRKRLLQEEEEQIKQLQKIMYEISRMAIKTNQMIEAQGAKLNLAAESITAARIKLQQGRKELVQANQYETNTNKKKFFCCLIIVAVVGLILLLTIASSK